MKNAAKTLIRAVIGIGLAVFLISSVIRRSGVDLQSEFANCRWPLIVFAFACYLGSIGFTLIRWQMLLKVQGIHLKMRDVLSLTMIGVFFNMVIPGAVSGDVIKMVYVSEHSKGKTTEAVTTILLDRVLGLFGLFLVALLSVLVSLPFVLGASLQIQYGAVLVGGGSLVGVLALLTVEFREKIMNLPGVGSVVDFGRRNAPQKATGVIIRLIAALDLYRGKRIVVGYALLLSIAVHSSLAVAVFSVGRSFHEETLKLRHYFISTQVANTAGAIPITPAGFGSRDIVLSAFLFEAGAEKEKAGIIPACYSILIVISSLIGGVFFIFTKRKLTNPDAVEADNTAMT